MSLYVLLGTALAIAALVFLARRMPARAAMALGVALAVVGAGAVAALELRFQPDDTVALDMPLPLARAATTDSRIFIASRSDPFDILLQLDRGAGVESFGCLTGEDGFEALCLGREPELDVGWTVTEAGVAVARGGGDRERWHARQAALDPKEAARRQARFHAYANNVQEPSDQTPLYHRLGVFHAEAGHAYEIVFTVRRAAPTLSGLHPRVVVGLAASVTQGLGPAFLGFALLCIAGGALMLLMTLTRTKSAP
ncbi:MAG: hypothetical protein WDN03_19615 [Rhizomicrobium sp.]